MKSTGKGILGNYALYSSSKNGKVVNGRTENEKSVVAKDAVLEAVDMIMQSTLPSED